MKNFKIYFSDDSDLVEAESVMKEWRGDVIVFYDGLFYQLDFITIERINNEYDVAQKDYQTYYLTNTVVVENVKKDTIIREICNLVESNIIKSFSTIDLQQFYRNAFPELQDIKNWKQIY